MKSLYLFLAFAFVFPASAQNDLFSIEQMPVQQAVSTTFLNRHNRKQYICDINNDQLPDIVLVGLIDPENQDLLYYAEDIFFYINNGDNTYDTTGVSLPVALTNFSNINLLFKDFNNDNHIDFIFTGMQNFNSTNGEAFVYLFLNDGTGNFILGDNEVFTKVWDTILIPGDIDNDGDTDLIIKGSMQDYTQDISVYQNDGNAGFTKITDYNFPEYSGWYYSFVDLDNDGDEDLLISVNENTTVYSNNGSGNFSEVSPNSLNNIPTAVFSVADYNNDSLPDLLVKRLPDNRVFLYKNLGNLQFEPGPNISINTRQDAQISFTDIDSDGDNDIFISANNDNKAELYLNDGTGNFTPVDDIGVPGFSNHTVSLADFNNDGYTDILLTGYHNVRYVTLMYLNDGNQHFNLQTDGITTGIAYASTDWGDIDGDGDSDLIVSGYDGFLVQTRIFINGGSGNFSLMNENPFENLEQHLPVKVKFVDINNDQYPDIFISGGNYSNLFYRFYFNDGTGHFNNYQDVDFGEDSLEAFNFADFDNDGDQDIIFTTNFPNGLKMYLNDGNGNFTISDNVPDIQNFGMRIASGDIDNDNDIDLIITGQTEGGNPDEGSYVLINDGTGNFSIDTSNSIIQVSFAAIGLTDIDNDQDLDLIINGVNECMMPCLDCFSYTMGSVYTNDGTGHFTEMESSNGFVGNMQMADINNDGNIDIMYIGTVIFPYDSAPYLSAPVNGILYNDGTGNFTETDMNFENYYNITFNFNDVDNDGDQDFVLFGKSTDGYLSYVAKLYRNNTVVGFSEILPNDEISIYPNPTTDGFHIDTGKNKSKYHWSIYDTNGQLISQSLSNKTHYYPLHLPAGLYILKIVNEQGSFYKKLLVE